MRVLFFLLGLLLAGCQSDNAHRQWWQPSDLEIHAGANELDHDFDNYDGQSYGVGFTLGWPLGLRREAYSNMARMDEMIQRAIRASHDEMVNSRQLVVASVDRAAEDLEEAIDTFNPVVVEEGEDDKIVVVNPAGPVGPPDPHEEPDTEVTVPITQHFADDTPTSVFTPPNFFWAALAVLLISAGAAIAAKAGLKVPFLRRADKEQPSDSS